MDYAVEVTTVEEQFLAASRRQTTIQRVSQEIQRLLDAPWAFIREHPDLRRDGHNVAVYWNRDSVEVGIQIVEKFEPTELVVCSATPAGQVARTTHFGPYSELGPAHDAVLGWCKRNNRALAGPFWEIYGDWEEDPARLQTDVLYLLATD